MQIMSNIPGPAFSRSCFPVLHFLSRIFSAPFYRRETSSNGKSFQGDMYMYLYDANTAVAYDVNRQHFTDFLPARRFFCFSFYRF